MDTVHDEQDAQAASVDEQAAREREAQRNAARYRVERKLGDQMRKLAILLDGLGDATDKAEIAALGNMVRREYVAARELVKDHVDLGGSSWSGSTHIQPFDRLYDDD
jgi:hypothetical protein